MSPGVSARTFAVESSEVRVLLYVRDGLILASHPSPVNLQSYATFTAMIRIRFSSLALNLVNTVA